MLVYYTKPRPCRAFDPKGAATQFIPGINELKESTWNQLMKNKNFKRDLDREYFKVVAGDPETKEDGEPTSPLTTVRDAKLVIRETYDRKLLLNWRSLEARKTVIDEINAQIARIDKRVKAKSEDDLKD